MKILHLTIKKKFFDMIASGVKLEEYRSIKPYWLVRFIDWRGMAMPLKEDMCKSLMNEKCAARWNFKNNYCNVREYDAVEFKNGYSKTARTMLVEFKGIQIGPAKPEWSDNWQGDVFVIKLGNVIPITR